MKLKSILLVIAISAFTAVLSVFGYEKVTGYQYTGIQDFSKLPVNYASFIDENNGIVGAPVDFTAAATTATPAVVHIKTKTKARQVTNNNSRGQRGVNPWGDLFGDDFSDFFGGPRVQMIPEQKASGSGVLVSNDGYIVTNNHVIKNADEINVTLTDKKTYKATVIGTDPNSDLAVIKIDGKDFPHLVYGNSDDVKLGQWVLAVGYPLNLEVTVTAGIVSAKARSIGINEGDGRGSAIESFIQTDAAVNMGNSGGALINTRGELIGINSAIASPTGAYAGYSYAIPVNITKKIIGDIIKFGTVQRGYIGIAYAADGMSEEQRKANGVKEGNGVYVTDVPEDGAAKSAGIKKGDFITKIDNATIGSGAQLQEQIARYKPGDKINITYVRDGKTNTTTVTLKNKAGNYSVVKAETSVDKLGAELADLDKNAAQKHEVTGGIVVKKIGNGALKNTRMQEGFVITNVNGRDVANVEELKKILANSKGQIRLEGFYPGYEGTYAYPLNLDGDNEVREDY